MNNKYNITLINYCDKNFKKVREINSKTFIEVGGGNNVIEYDPSSIDDEFYHKYSKILSNPRGAGLWLWKPYIINKALESIPENDYLFYCDSGAYFIDKVSKLIPPLLKSGQDIMVFELPLLSKEWTKEETFLEMKSNDKDYNQILASYILIRNTKKIRLFIKEWLDYCCIEKCISPDTISEHKNPPCFVQHREDQSVFSILCRKYGIIPFREPSQYGRRNFEYMWVPSKKIKRYSFKPQEYTNSPYPQILVSTRKADPEWMKVHEKRMDFLYNIGIYNRHTYPLISKLLIFFFKLKNFITN